MVLTLAVPNWVIVALLAVMMSLTAWRSLQKGAQLYRAEAQQMKAQAAPAVDDAGEGPEVPFASPFQSQASSSLDVKLPCPGPMACCMLHFRSAEVHQ